MSSEAWTTTYGSAWRPVEGGAIINFERTAHIDGRGSVVRVWPQIAGKDTGQLPRLEIYVSEKGRSVRVWYAAPGGSFVEMERP